MDNTIDIERNLYIDPVIEDMVYRITGFKFSDKIEPKYLTQLKENIGIYSEIKSEISDILIKNKWCLSPSISGDLLYEMHRIAKRDGQKVATKI